MSLCLFLAQNHAFAQPGGNKNSEWLRDFDFVVSNIKANHPNPYYRVSKTDFDEAVAEQEAIIREADSDAVIITSMMKVVARLEDGHTNLYPKNIEGANRWLPIRVRVFEDGVYVVSAPEPQKSMVGAELTEINGVAISQIEFLMNAIIPADNDFGRRNYLPFYIVNSFFLKGLGIIDTADSVKLGIRKRDGSSYIQVVDCVEAPYGFSWYKRSMKGPGNLEYAAPFDGPPPLYLESFFSEYENFKFNHLNDRNAIFLQINQVVDSPDLSFLEFQKKFWDYFDDHQESIKTLVLDLRFNTGGNGNLIAGFVTEFIRREGLLNDKTFAVLTGPQTFSAAIMLVSQLKLYTNAIFVGEPMGGPLHLFSTALQLGQVPSGRFEFHVSSAEFHLDLPLGRNYVFPPQIPVVQTSEEFFSGTDSLLEYVLENDLEAQKFILKEELYREGANCDLVVAEAYSAGLIDEQGLQDVVRKAKRLNHDWNLYGSEPGFYAFGSSIRESYLKYEMLYVARAYAKENKPAYAEAFFELLTILVPDYSKGWVQYAEFLQGQGNITKAAQCYKKALEINPDDRTAIKGLAEIE